ncbi:hypothetical protein B0T17DRAFT_342763 [Bombardia bombarda]|uniref:Uncharacterized protein n=1 Tax=Bombardia bombarda TaxID=252184 RepID=A0AA40BYH6_9PEZI|nr:hypothetical protein B0T17DRAFT_342763 [Bombardia bombarda]
MSSLPFDLSSTGDWLSGSGPSPPLRSSSSQSSRPSTEDQQLQHFLGTNWSTYMSAQHTSREVDNLKRSIDHQISHTNASIASLQRDLTRHQELVINSDIESKARCERVAAGVIEIKAFQTNIPSLQLDIAKHKEQTLKTTSELTEKLTIVQQGLNGLRDNASRDLGLAHDQYCPALEKIEFLQGELKELREEKAVLGRKMAALQIELGAVAHTQARQELQIPTDMIGFLGQILSRREELMRLLDKPSMTQPGTNPVPEQQLQNTIPVTTGARTIPGKNLQNTITVATSNSPTLELKRHDEVAPLSTSIVRRTLPATNHQISDLFNMFRRRYMTNPPRSDVAFIWEFLGSIKTTGLSEHIQESLMTIIPDLVAKKRDLRPRTDKQHILLSPRLTWPVFQRALKKVSLRSIKDH